MYIIYLYIWRGTERERECEVHFNFIHYFSTCMTDVIRRHNVFFRVREDDKGKETEFTNKGGCCK